MLIIMQAIALLSALALVASIGVHALALTVFPALHLLDFPERYGLKRPRLPYPTGVLASTLFLLFFFLLFPHQQKEIGVMLAVALLGLVSVIDDRRPLPFWQRLFIQLLICMLLFATGSRIYTITHPFGGFLKLDELLVSVPLFGSLPIVSGLFTILWLGLTMNALNWFDGIPGQVTLLSAIGFVLLGCLAVLRTDQPDIALLCFVLAGISLGAAFFDFPPARVIIGDSGSMFFGLMLGLIGILSGGKVATAFIVLAVPLLDAVFVVVRRLMNRQSPFRGNQDHLHHRLLRKGWSARSIVLLTAATSGTFGTAALFLSTNGKALEMLVLFVLMLIITHHSRATNI